MKTKKKPILPQAQKALKIFGEDIRLARLRRRFSMQQVTERAGISCATLGKIEKGDDGVAMGSYFQVLVVLGLEERVLEGAQDDELGRRLQDARLIVRERAPKWIVKR